MPTTAQNQWITRVLGVEVPADDRDKVDRRQLLQRWRAAWREAELAIAQLGDAVIALPEVKSDARAAEARAAVGRLPGLLPQLGGELETLLAQPAEADAVRAAAASYRKRVASAAGLGGLEAFAAKWVGVLGAREILDRALADIEQGLGSTG